MELHNLCEAAITGDTDSLHNIVDKNSLILHKLAAGCFNGAASPLHVATISKQTDFVKALLSLKPELKLRLTEVLDSQLRSALHLASAMGNVEIVKLLLEANPKMCLVRDRDGKTPLHVAAMGDNIEVLEELVRANPKMCLVRDREGNTPLHVAAMGDNIEVLEELVRASPQAARVRVDQNETILHLCVKHNQLGGLKKLLEMIHVLDLVNAKDNDGNTILHLAVLYEHFEIVDHVLGKEKIDVNATNATGHTAMDILFLGSEKKEVYLHHMEDLLRKANAKPAKYLVGGDWLTNKRESLMVVASLIATMAFQAGVSPPGGVWQDDSKDPNGHRAGEAVMAYNYPISYPYFLRFNTIGFVASLSTILLLMSGLKFRNKATMWILIVTMWLAITSMAISYAFSNVVITPKDYRQPLNNTILIAVIVWSSVMTLLLVKHTIVLVAIFAEEWTRKMKAIKRLAVYL